MTKILGVGWAKTGTTTLGTCLELLGYDHQPQNFDLVGSLSADDIQNCLSVADTKDSFEDWPWLLLYKEFDAAFPGSKFILTTRDEDGWIASYRNMLASKGHISDEKTELRRVLYGLPFPHVTDKQLLARYRQHNRDVRDYFADRPDDLLVVNWSKGHGWDRLCEFLGKPVPDIPFPHANKAGYGARNLIRRGKSLIKRALDVTTRD